MTVTIVSQNVSTTQVPAIWTALNDQAQVGDYFRLPFVAIVQIVEVVETETQVMYLVKRPGNSATETWVVDKTPQQELDEYIESQAQEVAPEAPVTPLPTMKMTVKESDNISITWYCWQGRRFLGTVTESRVFGHFSHSKSDETFETMLQASDALLKRVNRDDDCFRSGNTAMLARFF